MTDCDDRVEERKRVQAEAKADLLGQIYRRAEELMGDDQPWPEVWTNEALGKALAEALAEFGMNEPAKLKAEALPPPGEVVT